MVYGVTGRMFINPTALDGSGGIELHGVEGDRYRLDPGMEMEIHSDQGHHRVKALPMGAPVVSMPLRGADDTAVLAAFGVISNDGKSVGPSEGVSQYTDAPVFSVLILPLDPTKRALYVKEAQLHPDTQREIAWEAETPVLPDVTQLLCSSVDDGSETDAYKWAELATIASHYDLPLTGGDGGGGEEPTE